MNTYSMLVEPDNYVDLAYNLYEGIGRDTLKESKALLDVINLSMSHTFERNSIIKDYCIIKFSYILHYEIIKTKGNPVYSPTKGENKRHVEKFIRLPLIGDSLVKLGFLDRKMLRDGKFDIYERAFANTLVENYPLIQDGIGLGMPMELLIKRSGDDLHVITNDFSFEFLLYYDDMFNLDFLHKVEEKFHMLNNKLR